MKESVWDAEMKSWEVDLAVKADLITILQTSLCFDLLYGMLIV